MAACRFSIDLGLLSVVSLLACRQRGVGSLESGSGPFQAFQSPYDRVSAFPQAVVGGHVQSAVALAESLLPSVKPLFAAVSPGFAGIGDAVPLVSDLVSLVRQTFPLVGDVVSLVGGEGTVIRRSLVPLVVVTVAAGIRRALPIHVSTLGDAVSSGTGDVPGIRGVG